MITHGSGNGYKTNGCRCAKCRAWNADDCRRRRKLKEAGFRLPGDIVDATPAREHLALLRAEGIGITTVANRIGLQRHNLHRILRGEATRCRRDTLDAILTLGRDAIAETDLVDATLTERRLQGLMALGWPAGWIRAQLGIRTGTEFIYGSRVTAFKARRIAALARQIGDRPGPSQRTATYARHRGWQVPAYWDDEGQLSA